MLRLQIPSKAFSTEDLVILEFLSRDMWLTSKHLKYRLTIDCYPPVHVSTMKVVAILLKLYESGLLYHRYSARGSERFAYKIALDIPGGSMNQ